MATVSFKAKVSDVFSVEGELLYREVRVPVIGTRHCDMAAFRGHPRFQGLANSELFLGALKGTLEGMGVNVGGKLRLDSLPPGVAVDDTGFLAVVTIEVGPDADWRVR
ncbi:hypothetical protein [Nocardia sp. NRRL S-836]|uniref:hypothetical protein n=1 Tax=Nocardia sp. NRRL S-836 TaxID=1519492 RepID=UPI0006AE9AAD|nr:hypothetical protein [Nocardia sp. NRRL S-836]KOV77444.1 hypothetical protein ADL03_41690 [Nocardia sp. NRRL S-836]